MNLNRDYILEKNAKQSTHQIEWTPRKSIKIKQVGGS